MHVQKHFLGGGGGGGNRWGPYVRKTFANIIILNLTDVTRQADERIAIEGPEQSSVNFEDILEVFKEKIIEFNFKN